ncbi:STAS domain-containing protein [Chloroflexia bacterium SDU3-3]|nr:STAS domain-containing protein [Chloroflexia bacterium SDU3-3]
MIARGTPMSLSPGFISLEFLQDMIDAMPMLTMVYEQVAERDFQLALISSNMPDTFSMPKPGTLLSQITHPEQHDDLINRFLLAIATGQPQIYEDEIPNPHGFLWVHSTYTHLPQRPGTPRYVMQSVLNITEQKERELRDREQQELIIAQQQAALAELSTPLLAISDTIVVMPLIGTVDSRRVQQLMGSLLEGVSEKGARIVILDITGVPIVDTQVANVFIHASQAVKLLGAKVVLTGIRPEVAQTLVGLGVDLAGIITLSSLQSGIAFALRQ